MVLNVIDPKKMDSRLHPLKAWGVQHNGLHALRVLNTVGRDTIYSENNDLSVIIER